MHPSMLRQSRGEGRGRPNGRAYNDYPPEQDHGDPLDPPYYVQDLNKHRSLAGSYSSIAYDVKKMPEDYRQGGPTEPLYHQPPTALETQDRYHGACAPEVVPGLVPSGANSLTSPYFAQHQLRMGQGGGRRFSPLRLPLGASDSSWRRCSWRCTAVVFVCVTLCLAATTTFLATSQVSGWQTTEACLEENPSEDTQHQSKSSSSPALNNLPPPRQPSLSTGKSLPSAFPTAHDALDGTPWAAFIRSLSSMSVDVAPSRAYVSARLRGMKIVPHVIRALPHYYPFPPPLSKSPPSPPSPPFHHAPPPLPAVYLAGPRVSSSSTNSARSDQQLSKDDDFDDNSHGAADAVGAAAAAASAVHDPQHFHDSQHYLSSQSDLDDVHAANSLLFPLVDVYQYPPGTPLEEQHLSSPDTSVPGSHVVSVEQLPGDVTRESSASTSQRVPDSTGNKLNALDTRSSGIDLGATGGRDEEVEKHEKEEEEDGQQHQLVRPSSTVFTTLLQKEKRIILNQGNGVSDNNEEIERTSGAHNPSVHVRHKRSALSPHSLGEVDEGASSPASDSPATPSLSPSSSSSFHSTPAAMSLLPSSALSSSPSPSSSSSSSTSALDSSSASSELLLDALVSEFSSTVLMNKQVTSDTPTTTLAGGGGGGPLAVTNANSFPHLSPTTLMHTPSTSADVSREALAPTITERGSPPSVSSPSPSPGPLAEGPRELLESYHANRNHNHEERMPRDRGLDESIHGDAASLILRDQADSPTLDKQASAFPAPSSPSPSEIEVISGTLDNPSPVNTNIASAPTPRKRAENLSQENASVHVHEYQVTPETWPPNAPLVSPSFEGNPATETSYGETLSGHAYPTQALHHPNAMPEGEQEGETEPLPPLALPLAMPSSSVPTSSSNEGGFFWPTKIMNFNFFGGGEDPSVTKTLVPETHSHIMSTDEKFKAQADEPVPPGSTNTLDVTIHQTALITPVDIPVQVSGSLNSIGTDDALLTDGVMPETPREMGIKTSPPESPSPAVASTVTAVTATTAAEEKTPSAGAAIFTSPSLDGPIKEERLGVNDTNVMTTGRDSPINQNEDTVTRESQVTPATGYEEEHRNILGRGAKEGAKGSIEEEEEEEVHGDLKDAGKEGLRTNRKEQGYLETVDGGAITNQEKKVDGEESTAKGERIASGGGGDGGGAGMGLPWEVEDGGAGGSREKEVKETQTAETSVNSYRADRQKGRDGPGILHQDYPSDQRDYGPEIYPRYGEEDVEGNEESKSGDSVKHPDFEPSLDDGFSNQTESHSGISILDMDEFSMTTDDANLNHSASTLKLNLGNLGHGSNEGVNDNHQINSTSIHVPDRPQGKISISPLNELLTTLAPDSMTSQLTPNAVPLLEDQTDRIISPATSLHNNTVDQIALATQLPGTEAHPSPRDHSRGEEFYNASQEKPLGLPTEEGQIPVIPTTPGGQDGWKGEGVKEENGNYNVATIFTGNDDSSDSEKGTDESVNTSKPLSSFDYPEIHIEHRPQSDGTYKGSDPHHVEEKSEDTKDAEKNFGMESHDRPVFDAIILRPATDGIAPSEFHPGYEQSRDGIKDYSRIGSEYPSNTKLTSVLDEPSDDSSAVQFIGVNDLTPKDPREKLIIGDSISPNNQTRDVDADRMTVSPTLPPPPGDETGDEHSKKNTESPSWKQSEHVSFVGSDGEKHFSDAGIQNDPLTDDFTLESPFQVHRPHQSSDERSVIDSPSFVVRNVAGGPDVDMGIDDREEYEEEEVPYIYERERSAKYSSYEVMADYEEEEYEGSYEEHMAGETAKPDEKRLIEEEELYGHTTEHFSDSDKHSVESASAVTGEETKCGSSASSSPSAGSIDSNSNQASIPSGSDGNIMLQREPWQSEDPTCKCSCQCDGGANPPVMPARVAANLNASDPGGDRHQYQHHDEDDFSTTTPSIFSTTTPTPPSLGASPAHRHRHHHGESSHSTTPPPPPTSTSAPTSSTTEYIETIWIPARNPYETLYPAGDEDGGEDEEAASVRPPSDAGEDPEDGRESYYSEDIFSSSNSSGSISVRRPHQITPPDGSSFSALQIGEEASFKLAPYGYWNLHLTLKDATDIRIVLTIPRGTSLGLYARRSALPTHTQHDIMRILRGTRPRDVRASPNVVEIAVEEVLEAGEWFLSLYNDDGDPHQVALVISRGPGVGECPQRCNDRGDCILGRCQCRAGYSGVDCSQMLCPILCSGHGEYEAGHCKCHPSFKGKECQLRHHECEVSDCHGHGRCIEGRCECAKGFKGEFCAEVDCPHPTCSDHGWCAASGTCVCQKGWQGSDCSIMDSDALQCLPDCNGHGAFNMEAHECVCDHPWTGSDCSKKACSLDCGSHGACENDACTCESGWTGPTCSQLLCDPRCSEHGQCKNGTCVCMTGWNGRHCTLSGCPGNCQSQGTCEADSEQIWRCRCQKGWDGPDCSVMLETVCNDHYDNDRDGLTDCEDPECCTQSACIDSQLCVSRATPFDILLRKTPAGPTASFFEKIGFLIEEDSLQLFTKNDNFNRRRAAVVRGRVVTKAGRGIVGLRVSTNQKLEGFTLTRTDGWFDIMVNGGGAVTLSFGKMPFSPRMMRVLVPWNEVVVLDDIIMTVSGLSATDHADTYHDHPQRLLSTQCIDHDYDLLRPVVMATWRNSFQGKCPDTDAILAEAQVVQESVLIPGTGLYLVYHSSRSNGYESTLRLQLTPDRIPSTLRRVHLRIVLEGILFTRTFEADPAIKYTYAWNRRDVYRQSVYGVSVARVSVGYEHSTCTRILWEHQTARIAGYDIGISGVGGFNIHVHHAYNVHQGILQKGDGQNIYLSAQRHLVTTLLGTGEQREVDCGALCEGKASESPLLAPTCLAAAPDGSLYVGDFNLIRRVKPDGTVSTVARLNETRVSYRYHIAVSPLDGSVYVSDPEAHQVLRLESTDNVLNPLHNTIAVVGSGQRCLPGDQHKCGDGDHAIHARLTYPKGLAVSSAGDIYIADGTNIRVVSPAGIIHTVIGGHDHRSHWAPVPCNGTINMDQLHLRWPTELAISPLDGSLHILDDHLVLRVTPDSRVQVLTGRSLNCPTPPNDPPDVSRTALLLNPQSIAFSPHGELYVGESDNQRINRVRVITSDGRITTFAGADSRCNCREPACFCQPLDNVSATSAIFSSISSIAVTPDGVLHISDQAGYRVRSVQALLPELNDEKKEYEIFSPDTHEVYVFNRFGQHVTTKNLVTGQTIYTFQYTDSSSTGKLLAVTDAASNTIQLIRNHSGAVKAIDNPQKQRIMVSLNMNKLLKELVTPDGYNITFRYHGNRGLMRSKIEALGRTYSYEYDDQGRLVQAVLPTGQIIQLSFDLSVRGAKITVSRDGKDLVTTRVRGNVLSHDSGSIEAVSDLDGDGQLRIITDWNHEISLEKTAYRVLESNNPTAAEMFPILSRQQTHISDNIVNRYEWSYSPASTYDGGSNLKVSGTLRVNGDELLTLTYDRASSSEVLLSVSGQVMVNITYDHFGRPVQWVPVSPLVPSNVTYDHWGHITSWVRGDHSEEYKYDIYLRMESVTYADGTTVNYDYREKLTKPEKVTHPSGRAYGLVYDDAGSLRQVVTPRGSAYTLHLTTSLGFYRLILALPVDSIAIQMRLDERGRLLSVSLPGRGGTLLYEYNDNGEISAELYGHGYTEYTYYEETGLMRSARTKHIHDDVRTDYRYHGGLMKEMKVRYGSKSDLHGVKLKLQYDSSARLRKLEGDINNSALKEVYIRFDNQTGVLELISDLRIIRNNILETMLQNPKKKFVNTRKQDDYGRLAHVDMTLEGRTVYTMQLKYDNRNRISERLIEVAGRREGLNITYKADGQIQEAKGTHIWHYEYDENGNIVSHANRESVQTLEYDECDRVVSVDSTLVEYDSRGFVIRIDNENFKYNTKGQLVSAWDGGESWSFTLGYDHFGRVAVYRDHLNNATQIIYGRPDLPDLITHLHNPHSGMTMSLLYDDMNHLIAIDKDDGRYFVATDQNGTPIAVFDDLGSLIRSQVWSPFGRLIDYAGTEMWVGVGPWGGFLEPLTGIVILEGHAYHPKLLQWMTPRWDHLTKTTRQVTDVFVYRFMNNNPFNLPSGLMKHYYTDVSDWLELYGIELNRVLGSEYHENTMVKPKPVISVENLGASEVISGLCCQYNAGIKHLHELSFFSQSHIQRPIATWNGVPISRQASIFGPGVLVSNVKGRVLVTAIGEEDSVVIGDVIRTVLNNSIILDVSATHGGLDTFYFIKDTTDRASDDLQQLRRLSGIFQVSNNETERGHEIRMSTHTAHLVIMYGERVSRARKQVLKELEERAVAQAWEREAALIISNRPGTHAWSSTESDQLIREGRVHGYVATHIHSTSRYPILASDASNIVFKHETARKRRGSRRKSRKKSWRQRKKGSRLKSNT